MDRIRQKTSMQDIATALGISKNAVSLALNNKPGISDNLRNKVIKTAIMMNYGGYGRLGTALERNLVAICVPSAISGFSQFYSSIYWSVERELGSHGYSPLLTSISTEMEEALTFPPILHEQEVRAVVVVGILSKRYVEKLATVFEHLVLVDNHYMDLPLDSVATANVEGGYEATRFLVEKGFSKIGFVGQVHRYAAYHERCTGYRKALDDAGLPLDESIIFTDSSLFIPDLDSDAIIDSIIAKRVEVVFCSCDRVAIQLIGKLHARGLQIPKDVSILGFDDIENADIVSPPLTTMRVSRQELGMRAAQLLISRMESSEGSHSAITIYPRLILRESVKTDR